MLCSVVVEEYWCPTTGAAVDFSMFDPYDRNISAMMEENEWIVPYVTEALATDTDSMNGKIDFVTC